MKEELPEDSGFLCPDVKEFKIKGGILKDDYKFGLVIERKVPVPDDYAFKLNT